MKIVVFDDIPEHRNKVIAAISDILDEADEVIEFEIDAGHKADGTYEDRIVADLEAGLNAGTTLVVADRDLSAYSGYKGLSESMVRTACARLGIPECGYARGQRTDDQMFVELAEQREACIRLNVFPSIEEFAMRVVSIAKGFHFIRTKLDELWDTAKGKSPGKLLAEVLEKPEYAEKISLYASGDQNRLSTLPNSGAQRDERIQRTTCLLGYWLWDSVLRYPGVTVGEIEAAASYLDISVDDFKSHRVALHGVFSSAEYRGPFSGAKVKMWWRAGLDDMLAEANVETGRDLANAKLEEELKGCKCSVDAGKRAGYYCMFTQEPVSLENSRGGLPWFPRGADLARVSKVRLEELGPWI